jgi:hypothetical protein
MNTTAAQITAGQTITTVRGNGRTTTDTFTVIEVETFTVAGVEFVEVFHDGGSHTFAAAAEVVAA